MTKRSKSGYLYPTPVQPYPLRCITLFIPDEPNYREAFWGQLWQLARPWTWYQNTPVPDGQLQEVAAYWFELIWPRYQAYLAEQDECGMADCCPDEILRFTADGLSEISTDNGATWEGNAGDPRFLPIPFIPRPESPGEEKRCNSAYSVRKLLEEATDQLIANGSAWASLQALLDAILAIIAAIFPGIGTIAALIIAGIVAAIFFFGLAAFNAAMTEAVYDLFQCLVYCQLDENGQISTPGWIQLKLDIYNQVGGIAGNWLWGWVSSLGPAGINASVGMFTGVTADCSDCECDECAVQAVAGQTINLQERPDLGIGWWSCNTVNSNPPVPSGNGDCYADVLIPDCCLLSDYLLAPGLTNAPPGNRVHTFCDDTTGTGNYGLNQCVKEILWRTYEEGEIQFKIEVCP